jgi:hypothetical protein
MFSVFIAASINIFESVIPKDLLMDYCDKFQSKALFRRVKLLLKAYEL